MALIQKIFNFSDMRFTGILQQNQPTDDGSGGQVDNWVTLATTRCSLEKRSGRLSNGAGKMEYDRDYLLTCRFQTAIAIDSDTRWSINGAYYKIEDYDLVGLVPHLYHFIVTKNG